MAMRKRDEEVVFPNAAAIDVPSSTCTDVPLTVISITETSSRANRVDLG